MERVVINEYSEIQCSSFFQNVLENNLEKLGIVKLNFNYWFKVKQLIFLFRILFKMEDKRIYYSFYPSHSLMNRLLIKLLLFRKRMVIPFILDMDELREKGTFQREIRRLSKFKFIIVQNEKMNSLLVQELPKIHTSILRFYDLAYTHKPINRSLSTDICFSGSEKKALFLQKLVDVKNVDFFIYNDKFIFSNEYEINGKLKGSFGLVWDGLSVNSLSGTYGEYLKYFTPLKFTKYVKSGLPVIVHQDSAIADFVRQEGIGLLVSSLLEVQSTINKITCYEYESMLDKLKIIQTKLKNNEYLLETIENIEKHIS